MDIHDNDIDIYDNTYGAFYLTRLMRWSGLFFSFNFPATKIGTGNLLNIADIIDNLM